MEDDREVILSVCVIQKSAHLIKNFTLPRLLIQVRKYHQEHLQRILCLIFLKPNKLATMPPMLLRCCERRAFGHGHNTSQPSVHSSPFYGVQVHSRNPDKILKDETWLMRNQCLQDEAVDYSSKVYGRFCERFWRFLEGF